MTDPTAHIIQGLVCMNKLLTGPDRFDTHAERRAKLEHELRNEPRYESRAFDASNVTTQGDDQ